MGSLATVFGYRIYRRKSALAGGIYLMRASLQQAVPGTDAVLLDHLPRELIWPNDDQQALTELLQALHSVDVAHLLQVQDAHPGHTFGFEERYLPWAQAEQAQLEAAPAIAPGPQSLAVVHRVPLGSYLVQDQPNVRLDVHMLTYANDDAWLQATIRSDRSILSRALVDPVTGSYRIVLHYPGRYRALRVNQGLIKQILGPNPQELRRMAQKAALMIQRPKEEVAPVRRRRARQVPFDQRPHPAGDRLDQLPDALSMA